jgi:hypothetical protein
VRKSIAAFAATVSVTGMLLVASPAHASTDSQPPGQPQGQVLCLANHTATCITAADIEGIIGALGTIISTGKIIWDWTNQGKSGDDNKGEDDQQGTEGDNDGAEGLCLAARGGNAFMTSCGSLGTTWIAVPHNDGYQLESQYSLSRGQVQVLTLSSLNNNAQAYVLQPEPSGNIWWQTWSWYGPIAVACPPYCNYGPKK